MFPKTETDEQIQTSVASSRLLAVIVPLKPLLRSRVAWGSTMWDWVTDLLPLFIVTSFRVPFRMAVLPFLNVVFSCKHIVTIEKGITVRIKAARPKFRKGVLLRRGAEEPLDQSEPSIQVT